MGSRSIATREPQTNQTASDAAPTGYGTGTARPSTTAPNRARTGYGGICAQVLVISTCLSAAEHKAPLHETRRNEATQT